MPTTGEKTLGIMDRALSEYIIGGIKTTIPFHRQILKHPLFRKGEINTNFVANHPELMQYRDVAPESERLARLVAEISAKGYNPHVQLGEYRSVTTPRLGAFDPVLPPIPSQLRRQPSPYPQGDRRALLDFIRDSGYVHFTDTTPRDFTQSNSGNRFRLAEDRLIGPYLDNAGYFSIENGGGAHFHNGHAGQHDLSLLRSEGVEELRSQDAQAAAGALHQRAGLHAAAAQPHAPDRRDDLRSLRSGTLLRLPEPC